MNSEFTNNSTVAKQRGFPHDIGMSVRCPKCGDIFDLSREAFDAVTAPLQPYFERGLQHWVRDPVSSHALSSGLRIRATILFADVDKFTLWSADRDPGEMVDNLNAIFERAIAAASAFDGTVDKLIGDGIMVIWRCEGESPAEPSRALQAAQRMMTEIGKLGFRMASGIATGDVVCGSVGSHERRDFTVIGKVVNLASDLCARGDGDEILIDSATYKLLSIEQAQKFEPRTFDFHKELIYAAIQEPE